MYAENVRDSYHASILHLFFATFRINRLSQGGGLIVSPNGGCSVSSTIAPTEADDKAYAGMRSVDDGYRLEDPGLIDVVDEHPDRIRQHIVTVFPNFVVQKTQNAMALRFFTPNGVDRTNLEWIYFGYADDTPEMRKRRLRHLNLGGPAGFVSMEDGCVGGFVERGIATAEDAASIVAMGGDGDRKPADAGDRGRSARVLVAVAPDGRGMSTLLIAELNAAYASAIDNDRLEEWPDFFVEDCLYKITSVENHRRGYAAGIVYADSRAMLRDRVTALRRANIYERQRYRHIIGLPLVGANGAGEITAETPFLVVRIMRDGQQRSVRHRRLSRHDAGRGVAVCGSSSASRSATARISTRCSPFRSSFPGFQPSRSGCKRRLRFGAAARRNRSARAPFLL